MRSEKAIGYNSIKLKTKTIEKVVPVENIGDLERKLNVINGKKRTDMRKVIQADREANKRAEEKHKQVDIHSQIRSEALIQQVYFLD